MKSLMPFLSAGPMTLRYLSVFDGDNVRKGLVDITIDAGKIARIAASDDPTGRIEGPEIDLRGYYALPGFIDAHTHLVGGDVVQGAADYASSRRTGEAIGMQAFRTAEAARLTLSRGVTTVRDLTGRAYLDVQVRDAIAEGIVEGPRVLTSGLGLTITGGHVHMRCVEVDGPKEVRREVRSHVKAGVDWIKLMGVTGGMATVGRHPLAPQFTRKEIRAGVDEAHRANLRVAAHAHGPEGIRNAVLEGVDTIEHGIYLDDNAAEIMAEKGLVLVPTLLNEKGWIDGLAAGTLPAAAIARRQAFADEGFPYPTPEQRIAMARKHGVRVIAGTDVGGNANCRHGMNAIEMAMLADAGMSNIEALRAGTSASAEALGLKDCGRIAVGLPADIVLSARDISNDIHCLSAPETIAAVFKGGRLAAAADPKLRRAFDRVTA